MSEDFMGLAISKTTYLSEQDYLEAERVSEIKHAYFDGEIFAMSGAKANPQRIATNMLVAFANHLKGTPYSDMKVLADKGNKYYPDVVVACHQDGDRDFTQSPRLMVDVLSDSTRKFDKGLKRQVYQTSPTLEEDVLIEQDSVEIEVCRKAEGWKSTDYFLGDDITFTSIDLTLPMIAIYQRVDNQDMRDFLNETTKEQDYG
jgi:Uma2 family endonuclease